ncbi:hypothetical protein XAP3CFBP6996_006915 [Xanthomonas citri pv. fuscans CFBP 6996]|nr:hypothetical protein XAP3CFBP6996_006915 [Xanthomonas citri pv. fuscans CFBP 6996]QWN15622.1 hypothetical protein DGN02_06945 [Xanthomonas citri]
MRTIVIVEVSHGGTGIGDWGLGSRKSGIGNRESGIGNRRSLGRGSLGCLLAGRWAGPRSGGAPDEAGGVGHRSRAPLLALLPFFARCGGGPGGLPASQRVRRISTGYVAGVGRPGAGAGRQPVPL